MSIYDELAALFAAEFRIAPGRIVGDRPLKAYGLDSLALVDALLLIEEHFGVDLPDDMTSFRTLDQLAALVSDLLLVHAA